MSAVLPDDLLLGVSEVARALRVSKRTVQRMVKRGTLPEPIRLSSQTARWRASAIRALLEHPAPVVSADATPDPLEQAPLPVEPIPVLQGSEAKILAMIERLGRGESLSHPGDGPD